MDLPSSALLVVDVQRALREREDAGERRNNPAALDNVARLLAAWRSAGARVIHVRDASPNPASRFHPDAPGFAVLAEAREAAGEHVLVKHGSSAFVRTDLEALLRAAGVRTLVVCGAVTNGCVESTARSVPAVVRGGDGA